MAGTLAERVRTARLGAGLGARELSRRIGRSQAYITAIERGHIDVLSPDDAERIARETHVEASWLLLGYAAREHSPDYHVRALLEALPVSLTATRDVATASAGAVPPDEAMGEVSLPRSFRGRRLGVVSVAGDCLAPDVRPGDRVVFDQDWPLKAGAIVVALHDGETLVKRLARGADGGWRLRADDGTDLAVNGETRIFGTVVQLHRDTV